MPRLSPVVSSFCVVACLAGLPVQAVQRAFVASYGNDANTATNCNFADPCRGFTAALTVVDPGGELVALDAAGYGAVTITKSVTITANPGFYAGISASTGNAVTIATAAVKVTLRGLNINGIGATNGVLMSNGEALSIENCVISNFSSGNGVSMNVATAATLRILDTLVRDNEVGVNLGGNVTADISGSKIVGSGDVGLFVSANMASARASATVTDTLVSRNGVNVQAEEHVASALTRIVLIRSSITNGNTGIRSVFAGGPTVVLVSDSLVSGHSGAGFSQEGGGATLESFGNNTVRSNAPDVGTVTAVALR
jgi:hypothetical protein